MKILHLAYLFSLGGLEAHLMDLLRYYPDSTTQHVVVHVPRVIHEGARSRVQYMEKEQRLSFRFWNDMPLEQVVNEEQPDVIHVLSLSFMLDAYLISRKQGIPLVCVWHTPPPLQMEQLEPWHYTLLGHMSHDGIIHYSVSSYAANFYKKVFNYPQFETLWNGIELNNFVFSSLNREKIRGQYNIPHDALVIGSVGRVILDWKRQDWVVEAVEYLHKKGFDNVYGLIVGSDLTDFKKLEERVYHAEIGTYIKLAGLQVDTASFYSAFDIFAHPSKMESFGLVLVEAASCGLPIIMCTPYEPQGTEEDGYGIIRNRYNGLVVHADNKQAFFDGLEELVKNESLRKKFASIARQSVEKLSVQKMAQRYHDVFVAAAATKKKDEVVSTQERVESVISSV